MNRLATAALSLALALLTFFQFPGHTWLQQDSQIYVPILENQRDLTVLRNDMLAQQPHVAYTVYDEVAIFLSRGGDFRTVLQLQQIVTRALGIWGLYLIAASLGLGAAPAMLVAAICSLGASIAGPQVLTFEYEPTPRAFAVPLLVCAMGLTAQRRYLGAAIAAAAAFLYHPPTALPFWAVFVAIVLVRRRFSALGPLAAAVVLLMIAAGHQAGAAESQTFLARLTPFQEQLQRMRTSYNWISTWPLSHVLHHVLLFLGAAIAFHRLRHQVSFEPGVLVGGLLLIGAASMPLSWLLLEHFRWALIPQVQPMRTLLFVALAFQMLTAVCGAFAAKRGRLWEAAAWFALAYLVPAQPVVTGPYSWRALAVAAVLAVLTALAAVRRPTLAPAVAVAAFFAIPLLGGVVNYPQMRTPELAQLSEWARRDTPRDAVFLFADAGRSGDPGIFRAEALRAVYVDWKGGGQVNYLQQFGEEWWFRWQQTRAARFQRADVPKYEPLGISYIVLQPKNRLPRPAAFENAKYVAYALK